MQLTQEQQDILNGSRGETMARVMQTLIAYGEAFDAERMVPVTSEYGHTVISFGLGIMKPVYELYDKILADGQVSRQPFTADPRPVDIKNVPANLLQKIVFDVMYSQQKRYEEQVKQFGILSDDAYTCTCYLPQVGNTPKRGDILSWAESSAVVYANSVLGARCNRNSGIIEMFGSIAGCVPEFGLLTDDGRKADWVVELKTDSLPDAQLFGSAVGMKVLEKVPYVKGLDRLLGTELNEETCTYLKGFGAATASNGSVGLYHIENLTPEAVDYGEKLIREGAPVYVVDDAEIQRVKDSYPCIWKDLDAKPKLCFMGCPHMSLSQMIDWTKKLDAALELAGHTKVVIPTVFTAAPGVIKAIQETEYANILKRMGIYTSSICPLMFMNNPLCKSMPVITSSNKLRTYSSARFYPEDEILRMITGLSA